MKRLKLFLKKTYKVFIGIIIGAIITGTVVYAATTIAGSEIGYTDNSGLGANNVQDAIDKIYEKYEVVKSSGLEVKTCSGSNCKKCIRAKTLHKETCSQTTTSGYCRADGYASGDTITYGSTGTSGKLSTGDAFDCDVNGDGTYNAATERFYYVTDMNANTAVLIYYNNVSEGTPSNQLSYKYDASGANNNGPVTAITQLPTTTQWPNVSLTNSIRNITDEAGTVKVTGFNYGDKAARLITYQEIDTACFDGTTSIIIWGGLNSKCKFLMENTKYSHALMKTYGTWLETPCASISENAWGVGSYGYALDDLNTNNDNQGYGVRPTIEVLKTNIEY